MKEQNKGITLIALVISIIILIILAAISINLALGDDGIIQQALRGKKDYTEAELKTELEMKIVELQTDKIVNNEEFTREDLYDLVEIKAIVYSVGVPAVGEYKDYNFSIDENYEVTIGTKVVGEKPSIILTKSTDDVIDSLSIRVVVTISEGSIVSITKPDGETTEQTEFDYTVTENGIYRFMAEGSTGRRVIEEIEISNIKASDPQIESNYEFPTIKSTGIAWDGTTTITYDNEKGLQNEYSLDNGITWFPYEGPIEVTSSVTIKARSLRKGIVVAESSKLLQQRGDSVPSSVYDSNYSTGHKFRRSWWYLNVDASMWGKSVYISGNENSQPGGAWNAGCYMYGYDESGEATLLYVTRWENPGYNRLEVGIPENIVRLAFTTGGNSSCWWNLCEIEAF